VLCFVDYRFGIVLDAIDMTRNCNQGAMYNGYSGRHDSTAWGCWMWRRSVLLIFLVVCVVLRSIFVCLSCIASESGLFNLKTPSVFSNLNV
jgi:hypothetical protein